MTMAGNSSIPLPPNPSVNDVNRYAELIDLLSRKLPETVSHRFVLR
ncbi:MAG: hypothetical protein ACLU4J_15725 [Butyricimonas paravirosa]